MNEKNQRTILSIGILLIAFSTLYYFVFYIPKYKERDFVLKQEEKCTEDAKKYIAELPRLYYFINENYEESNLLQTKFNKKDNSCFIHFYVNHPPNYVLSYETIVSIWGKVEIIDSISCISRNGVTLIGNILSIVSCADYENPEKRERFHSFYKKEKEIFGK